MEEQRFESSPPHAAAMIESMRSFGYTPETAIADLIDNSLFADASDVWLDFCWNNGEAYVTILDNGCGMNEEILRDAMRPGTDGPQTRRAKNDLGRFGMGLKSASLSQCRRLVVASKGSNGILGYRIWDLDYVAETADWRLLLDPRPVDEERIGGINTLPTGTAVLWDNLDRMVGTHTKDPKSDYDKFLRTVRRVDLYLGMVFHRFLSKSQAGKNAKLSIHIRTDSGEYQTVAAWDPFMTDHMATDRDKPQRIKYKDGITVQGFIIPHRSKLNDPLDIERATGPYGQNRHQGFYVYRNNRMVVYGSWLGLGKRNSSGQWTKEDHYRLARLSIDIPNTMDGDWQIDIKKSEAVPPPPIREELQRIAADVRTRAHDIYRSRGDCSISKKKTIKNIRIQTGSPWKRSQREGKVGWTLDRAHPNLQKLLEYDDLGASDIEWAFRLIEENVPVEEIHQIEIDAEKNETTTPHFLPFEGADDSDRERQIINFYREMVETQGISKNEASAELRHGYWGMTYQDLTRRVLERIADEC